MPGEVLEQMAAGYAPVAGGVPPQFRTGFEGAPLLGQHPLLGVLAQPGLAHMMGGMGMLPMGMGHDQNAFDILRHRQFMFQQRQAMANVAYLDRERMMQTFRGMAAVSGTPFGADQRRAAGVLADAVVHAGPALAMAAPDFLEQLAGPRGSATVMAGRLMEAGRYQIDPNTGRLGVGADVMGRLAADLQREMFTSRGMAQTAGFGAGQVGALYGGLVQRGLLSADAGRLSAADIDRLALDPSVAERLRSFDPGRVTTALRGYASAVSAVRDIFGDMGRPNAPMGQLIQSLEAMTMGSLGQMDPERAGRMVRQTYNLSRSTGVSLDSAMVMQQHAAARAAAMGLDPVFAVQATHGSLAFGGAYRGLGLGAHTAWGAMSADQLQQLDANLRLGGAASNTANRLAVAVRLSNTVGGFQAGSEAANLVAAVRGGLTQFQGAGGMQSLGGLREDDFVRILTGAAGAGGQRLSITPNLIREMLGQQSDNRGVVEAHNIGRLARNMQGAHDFNPFMAGRLAETVATQLRGAGLGAEAANQAGAAIGHSAMRRIMGLTTAEFASEGTRNERIASILEEELRGTPAGARLGGMAPAERQAFLLTTAASFYGRANQAIETSGFRALGSLQNAHRLFDPRVLAAAEAQQTRSAFEGRLQEALTPIGRGTALQRAMGALQDMRAGGNAAEVVAGALGGVRVEDVNTRLVAPMQQLNQHVSNIRALQERIQAAPPGAARQAMESQLAGMLNDARGHAADLARTAADAGIFGSGVVGARDTAAALDTHRAVGQGIADVSGLRGGFGTQTTVEDMGRAREAYNTAGRAVSAEEAAAVLTARRRANAGVIGEADLRHAADAVRRERPFLNAAEAEAEARRLITQHRLATAGNLTNAEVQEEMRTGRVGTDAEARALVLAQRQATPLRPDNAMVGQALADLRRDDPRATNAEAYDLATNRLRARRWGVSTAEIRGIQDASAAGGGRRLTEQEAIATAVNAMERQSFIVSDADLAYARAANPALAGMSDAAARQAVLGERAHQRRQRFGNFWGSEDGARFRENVQLQMEQGETIAERLVTSEDTVRRFGTQAVGMHRQLHDIQQRRRVLAFRHTGGDVARLLAGDYEITDAGEFARLQDELLSLHGAERDIYGRLHATHGSTGRQFQTATREAALASLRARGAGTGDAEVAVERARLGNIGEAAALMGLTPEESRHLLTADDSALTPRQFALRRELRERSASVHVARGLSSADEEAVRAYGAARAGGDPARLAEAQARLNPLLGRLGVGPEALLAAVTDVIDPQLRAAAAGGAVSTSGMGLVEGLAGAFGLGAVNPDDRRTQELAQRFGGSSSGRQWAAYMTWSQQQLAGAAGELRGGGGTAALARRWREAMASASPEDRDRLMRQLQTDLGIDTGTATGRGHWDRLSEALDFQRRAGLLDEGGGGMSLERIATAYDRIRAGGELRPAGPGGAPGLPHSMHMTGRLFIDGRIGDLNARTGGVPGAAAAP